eukprot:CAMPEP_0115033056 /NCGR_PEP_ID=MMETSP0216-20121206/39592_1 /TAXON_ID=223996 /ORGANISM="Protocruzia adherens, Strain Boccale" /LENGTH=290 /DNA_ID=CAMNT_0002411205 /DNA_START=29 /DNA_END=901 /DNA_ORIENTATION=-
MKFFLLFLLALLVSHSCVRQHVFHNQKHFRGLTGDLQQTTAVQKTAEDQYYGYMYRLGGWKANGSQLRQAEGWGIFDFSRKTFSRAEKTKILNALHVISQWGEPGRKLIEDLKNKSIPIEPEKGFAFGKKATGEVYFLLDNTLDYFFNLDLVPIEGMKSKFLYTPFEIHLAHELIHAARNVHKIWLKDEVSQFKASRNGPEENRTVGLLNDEPDRPVTTENELRGLAGLEPREGMGAEMNMYTLEIVQGMDEEDPPLMDPIPNTNATQGGSQNNKKPGFKKKNLQISLNY